MDGGGNRGQGWGRGRYGLKVRKWGGGGREGGGAERERLAKGEAKMGRGGGEGKWTDDVKMKGVAWVGGWVTYWIKQFVYVHVTMEKSKSLHEH